MSTVEILTPYDQGEVTELSSGLFRKQVLPCRAINYTDKTGRNRTIDFNPQYLTDLARNFRGKAFDEVALQMADGANTHTLDPERKRAEIVGLEVATDGLYALVKPNNETAAQFLRENPKIGVSARIIEGMKRSDGKQFSRALHHVLVTTDPQIPGLNPWEEVQEVALASGSPDETVNLAGNSYEGTSDMAGQSGQGSDDTVTLELTAERAARLEELLAADEASRELSLAVTELANQPIETEENGDSDALELVRSEIELERSRNDQLTQRLNEAEIANELAEYARVGLAPAIIEAARPLLSMQSGAIELSNPASGDIVDPGATVRTLLDTLIQLNRAGLDVVDLNHAVGSQHGEDITLATERDAALESWSAQYGN